MLTFEGQTFPKAEREALAAFCEELEHHPHGGPVEGRIVIAEQQPGGITATMRRALQMYMKDDEYERWNAAQEGRPVVTGGKTFVADDEVITAVLIPMSGMGQEFWTLRPMRLLR
jgi:hypothetical protein